MIEPRQRAPWLPRATASRRVGSSDRSLLRSIVGALVALGACSCGRPPRIVEAKGGYFAFGNVEMYRRGPELLAVESGITDVQYAILVPFAAAVVAAVASGYVFLKNRRARRPADWLLPVGSIVLAALLGAAGRNATSIETVIDQQARTVQVAQKVLWGAIPIRQAASFDDLRSMHVVYRDGRGAYCASLVERQAGQPAEMPLFRFVDMLTDRLDLATCERLQVHISAALGELPRGASVERRGW